ncbi:hypothetical protein [Streptacidiphilus sp. P02-A3a]|uniref:hypothetical protein n=1 Tax=Streptacidiphilus sp. P02-A3a TaxID=2704468 RepID=UPI0015FC2C4C|nr:hypothetical protein [Streptacidiphilus sp. P02-A3a]QMU70107.1 hypothetical protein GXP74_19605 [Streptacidiphilus sp. P02-A3a]QMU70440.1 hypothetical protein GXP74_21755 [Streptacidiphilus sp. P02-A3a]
MRDSLPGPQFWARIRSHTGEVTEVQRTARGFMSDLTALVECEKGPFFLKAVANRPGGRRDSIIRERRINAAVMPISPGLRWCAESDEWIVLGFTAVAGRTSDFTPGSGDLPAVVALLNRMGALPLPRVARDWTETRWDRFAAGQAEATLFRGGALLHTDINESNLLIGDRQAWAVDWAWPTRGAAFIDPACLVVQLVAAGHQAQDAESWAARCPAWTSADPRALDAFAAASTRMYQRFAERKPGSWFDSMAAAARRWAAGRGVTL